MPKTVIVIPTFQGVERTRFLLQSIQRNDPEAFETPILIVEDPCGKDDVAEAYDALELDYPVQVHHLTEWSNMHGAARKAFQMAIDMFAPSPEWIVYLGDDLAVTKHALTSLIRFVEDNDLQTVGLVQPPYWNAHDLCATNEETDHSILWTKERDFYAGLDWTDKVPRNPHWEALLGEGEPHWPRPYVNVNGVGFAAHAKTYREVGGFAEGTWCLDESLSYRVWTRSKRGIVCLPGPPLVHYFGASGEKKATAPPNHDLHTEKRWIEAIGKSKSECDHEMRAIMEKRAPAIMVEVKKASYYDG